MENPIPRDKKMNRIPPKQSEPELSGLQLDLLVALIEKDQRLSSIYLGGLFALNEEKNPERFHHAAHSIRELMEKLPRYIEVSILQNSKNLIEMIRQLCTKYNDLLNNTCSYNHENNVWSGFIDKYLCDFLEFMNAFDKWISNNRPKRRVAYLKFLKTIDRSSYGLPPELENKKFKEWERLQKYFIDLSHHRFEVNDEKSFYEFNEMLSRLEKHLLRHFVPLTFEDFTKLDELIKRGEANA